MARALSVLLAGVMLAAPVDIGAQQASPSAISIGLLVPNRLDVQDQYPVFVETLRKLGYRQNLRIVTKEASGELDRLPALARELVDARVSVIVAFNTPGARAAIDATRQVPIVFTHVGDPVGSGFVTSLSRPGANVTGVSSLTVELAPKRMAILKEAVPSAKRIAVLFNPADAITAPQVRDVQSSAAALAVEVRLFPVRDPQKLPETFTQIKAWQADCAIWLSGQNQLFQTATVKLAAEHKLPVMVESAGDVGAGGLISYKTEAAEIFRNTAALVDRILKGTKPGDLPVQRPTKFELAINLKTAAMLGLAMPSSLRFRADHVVE